MSELIIGVPLQTSVLYNNKLEGGGGLKNNTYGGVVQLNLVDFTLLLWHKVYIAPKSILNTPIIFNKSPYHIYTRKLPQLEFFVLYMMRRISILFLGIELDLKKTW